MSNIETSASFLSLAELAQMDTTEVKVLMNRIPDAGLFIVECKEAKLTVTPSTNPEKPDPMVRIGWALEIVAVDELVDKEKDADSLVGRKLTDSATLWPKDFAECVGLVKGMYQKVRLDNNGPMGGDGVTVGFLDNAVGHQFPIRIKHRKLPSGDDAARIDWMPITDEMLAETAG